MRINTILNNNSVVNDDITSSMHDKSQKTQSFGKTQRSLNCSERK